MPSGDCILSFSKLCPAEFAAIYQGQLVNHKMSIRWFCFSASRPPIRASPCLIRQVRSEVEQTIMVRSPRVVVQSQ